MVPEDARYPIINEDDIDGLVEDCINPSALAMELLESFAEPSIF